MTLPWVGLDIGGANIKLATSDGHAARLPFPLWRSKEKLGDALRGLLAPFANNPLAVTMTGELADCFHNKQEGVSFIVQSVVAAAIDRRSIFYQLDGQFANPDVAINRWEMTAAANWHALATHSAPCLPEESGFLIDLGSTTCDIIPIDEGQLLVDAPNDLQRLQDGQLVYVGAARTPVCSLIQQVHLDGKTIPIAREFFSTTQDVLLCSGELNENVQDFDTADGRPATKKYAAQRLARNFCEDAEHLDRRWLDALVDQTRDRICELIISGIEQVKTTHRRLPINFILSGEGAELVEKILNSRYTAPKIVRWCDQFGEAISDCAAAYAVGCLANTKLSIHNETDS